MKKFVGKILALVIPIGVLVWGVNVVVDPSGLFFEEGNLREICEHLNEGGIVAGNLNISERDLQKEFIKTQEMVPEAVIIGSSRAMPISSEIAEEWWGYGECLNHAMSGSGVYDYYGVLGCYMLYQEELPKKILLSPDPWIFNANSGETRYETLDKEIEVCKNKVTGSESTMRLIQSIDLEKWKESLSLAYFQASLQALRSEKMDNEGDEVYKVVGDERETDEALRRPDGSTRHALSYVNKDQEDIEEKVLAEVKSGKLQSTALNDFKEIAPELQEMFEAMVQYLQKNGVEVTFYLAPVHPLYYEYFESNDTCVSFSEVEEYLLEYAQSNGITVYGSYDSTVLSMTETDFADGLHIRDNLIEKSFVLR